MAGGRGLRAPDFQVAKNLIKQRLKAVGSTVGKSKVAQAAVAAAKSPAGRMAGKVLGKVAKLTGGSAAAMPYTRYELEKRAGARRRVKK